MRNSSIFSPAGSVAVSNLNRSRFSEILDISVYLGELHLYHRNVHYSGETLRNIDFPMGCHYCAQGSRNSVVFIYRNYASVKKSLQHLPR